MKVPQAHTLFILAASSGMALLRAPDVAGQSTVAGISWGVSQPLSDTKAFAEGTSLRNVDVDLRFFLNPRLSVGAALGWHVFHDEVQGEEEISAFPGAISGLQFRTLNAVPIVATIQRYFGDAGRPRFYVGAGAGTVYQQTRVDVGLIGVEESSWSLTVLPEVGVLVPVAPAVDLSASARYQWSSGDLGTSAMHLNVGFAVDAGEWW